MSYIQEDAEYIFECGCGELFSAAAHAWSCRKCRTYLTDADFERRKVKNMITGADVPREWSGA